MRMQEMFNHSGDERMLVGHDTTRASCLLSIYSIIPCDLVNVVCPTFFFLGSLAAENDLMASYFCL